MVYIIVFIFIYPQTRPNTILIEGDKIEIKGSYGVTFTSNDITSMQWNINAPKILMRTNGLSIGDIRKGEFRINNQEKATLFLENMKGPYISIALQNGKLLLINLKTEDATRMLYKEIKKATSYK